MSQLLKRLGYDCVEDTSGTTAVSPLQQRADEAALSIVVAPDPEEEVRTVIRSVVAGDTPFHHTAIIYRQDNPYASLFRQELAAARIPYSGVEYQSLATTPTGLLLLGIVDLAASTDPEEVIDRDRLIDWITTTPVRQPPEEGPSMKTRNRFLAPSGQIWLVKLELTVHTTVEEPIGRPHQLHRRPFA